MSTQVISLNCPGCGAAVSTGDKNCKFCKGPIVISTFNSIEDMAPPLLNKYAATYQKALATNPDDRELNTSIAMIFLKLKLYDKAIVAFEKAIEDNFDNSEIFFYAAVAMLRGKKAFLAQRKDIDKIEEYVNAANMIEPKGIHHYLLAYVKFDHFTRKFLNTTPSYKELLEQAELEAISCSEVDIIRLYKLLQVERPNEL